MNRGKIVQIGAPGEVYRRPVSRFVADFMGRTNWLHGRVEIASDGSRIFKSDCGLGLIAPSDDGATGESDLCIRPESIDILRTDSAGAPHANRIDGKILDVALLGSNRQVVVSLNGGSRFTVLQSNRPDDFVAPGSRVA